MANQPVDLTVNPTASLWDPGRSPATLAMPWTTDQTEVAATLLDESARNVQERSTIR